MRTRPVLWLCIGALAAVGGCAPGGGGGPEPSSGAPTAAGPDLRRGEVLSFACQACHTLKAGEDHHIGPNLYGIFGKRAASAPDFAYSDALRAADFVWTAEQLDRWLAAPDAFLPGNNMPFAGYANPADRADLLAFLGRATAAQ